ncbi:BQ5605_C010g06184 [Microbotryum silenes-dioicae]|uniref:ornithine carbamoyltransferase n=1 Tax=Microbotryum silenes-dioicae TaxID=796604 RepID=A0A2X0MK03_9BASI|nr:BQ5605_C010g06184 [Microbotryum silenes-dioicae]
MLSTHLARHSKSLLLARPPTLPVLGLGHRRLSTAPAPTLHPSESGLRPPHLLTLADLSVGQIQNLISSAIAFKKHYKKNAIPLAGRIESTSSSSSSSSSGAAASSPSSSPIDAYGTGGNKEVEHSRISLAEKSLDHKTVALMFSKRSTRTRVASESAVHMLGGHPMFLGAGDIQLGVNESLYDTSRVVSSMVDGIMARVGHHSEVETLAANSSVPVINALSHLYHPTQILADLQTLLELHGPFSPYLSSLSGLTVAWIGDSNNILNEMMVTYPRLGINLQVATPKGYELEPEVLARVKSGLESSGSGGHGKLVHTNSPEEAVKNADVVVTDTWISMGQEEEAAKRLKDFKGYQITNDLLKRGGANKDAVFMHCLPRHEYEVDDEVFYGPKSIVFQEAENRKWTILAVFDAFIGKWKV